MKQGQRVRVLVLPKPAFESDVSLEETLRQRRSVREFAADPLTLEQVAQLLWSAQGITGAGGLRTAPSAGALYPLELYLVAGNVDDVTAGVYHYDPERHRLIEACPGDVRKELAAAALGQDCVQLGAVVLVLAAVYERTTGKYGRRGERYVHMDAAHAAQNVCLQAVALGLGTVVIGAFDDRSVRRVLGLPSGERPLVLLPVGRR
ncbi:MAG: SagB/ThcOx family dehydrogenase [Planctomycetota bacterium]|jgi:SagB-type dehydrogenase family enzyme